MVSGMKTSLSVVSWCKAIVAASKKAASTLIASLALVSKYGIGFGPLDLHHWVAFDLGTRLSGSRSTLFPITTNGKLSGSLGLACERNSSLQLFNCSKDFSAVIS